MTTPPKSPEPPSTELRQSAEAQLKKQAESSGVIPGQENYQKMLHELQVHQIELEMQNEQLQQARTTERKASQRYVELFEFAPIGYFVIDPRGIISNLNLRGASLLGVERINLTGAHFVKFVVAEHKQVFERFLLATFEGEGLQCCEILVQIDTRKLWFSIEANLGLLDTKCLISIIDITERKHSRQALEESEKRFRLMFEETADALVLLDPIDNKIIDCNAATAAMLGFKTLDELLPLKPFEISPPLQPDGRKSLEKSQEMIAIALRNGSHRFEWMYCSSHRENFLVEVLHTPMQLGKQQVIMSTWRDIDERKKKENEHRELLRLEAKLSEEREKRIIYRATVSSAQHILNNFLNNMLLFKMKAEKADIFDAETKAQFEYAITQGTELVKKLSAVEILTESNIKASIDPKSGS
jgi:PAS domain S-box-containing protein